MKKLLTLTLAVLLIAVSADAKTKRPLKVSVLGDSYSTFEGVIPQGYAPFYPNEECGVTDPSQTWWGLFVASGNYVLEANDSWGGTTICNTGYRGNDVRTTSFRARSGLLGNPDIIFVFGGTNDSWAGAPIGEYNYDRKGVTEDDCLCFRPALAQLIYQLRKQYRKADIYYILNSELSEGVTESTKTICGRMGAKLVELHDIEKHSGHPTFAGMQAICDQLKEVVK
ncbi:MAG: hypothetical protein HUJ91_03105 [Bacteroidales bacterium]|nr:hypothetical protein [Bacteroidales bacterium]